MKPGKYKAKVIDYGTVKNQKGEPQVKVTFDVKTGDGSETFSYFGNVNNETSVKYTTKNLLTLGANQSNIDKVEFGKASGVLDLEKEFELVVEEREYNNKKYTQIKFINDPSQYKSQEYVPANGALGSLKGVAAALIATGEAPKNEPKKADAGF